MKIGIVGWGVEGQSAYRYFGPEQEYLIVNEQPFADPTPQNPRVKLQFLDKDRGYGVHGSLEDLSYLDGIENCDKIVYTPTAFFALRQKFGIDKEFWAKATTAQSIFFEEVRTKNIIGVTGTKGKGTTSTLIAKMLEAQGQTVHLGGNIGRSVLDFLNDVRPPDWVVLELSNFQLKNLTYSPHIGVCLIIAPEHLDWHPDVADYIEAKANLFKYQKPDDIAVYFANDDGSKKMALASPGKKVPYFAPPGAYIRDDGIIAVGETEVMPKTEVKLLGEHNLQNICAALTAVFEAVGERDPSGIVRNSGIPRGQSSGASRVNAAGGSTWIDKAKQVLSSFGGLEHRLELVRELQGVKYYDDSFATTPDAAIVALKAFKAPKVIILGGSDKGLNLEPLADEVVRSDVRHAVVIGDTADKITRLLNDRGFTSVTTGLEKMPEIVAAARRLAQPGDVVLLSTGCASFGLFKDYKDRGNLFKQAVLELS